MQKNTKPKLLLKTTTIRSLDAHKLEEANGARPPATRVRQSCLIGCVQADVSLDG
jgi:hypothetical protein